MGNTTPKLLQAENMEVNFDFEGEKFEGYYTGSYWISEYKEFCPTTGELRSKNGVIYNGFFKNHPITYMTYGTIVVGNTTIVGQRILDKDKKIVPHNFRDITINPEATDSSFAILSLYYDHGVPDLKKHKFSITKKDMIMICEETTENIKNLKGNVFENHKNGTKFAGEYRNGKRHGYGTEKKSDGTIFEGEYRDGKRFGVGIETSPDGTEKRGYWIKDEFMNNGTIAVENHSEEGVEGTTN